MARVINIGVEITKCDCGEEISEGQTACDYCRVVPCWWCDEDFAASALTPVEHKGRTIHVCAACASEVAASQMRRAS